MALISQSDLQARLGRTLTAEEASAFGVINSAMQGHIERMIGSSVEEASLSTRYYDGGLQHLPIDPCTDVEWVKQVDDDDTPVYTYDTSDYTLEPRNWMVKTMVRHRSSWAAKGINNVAVRAKFSIWADESIRNLVKNAILEALVSEVDNSDNILKESIEGYSVEYASTQAKDSLASIKYLFPGI